MKKQFNKIRKSAMELAMEVNKEGIKSTTEEDLNILAEAIDILSDMYDSIFEKIFVKI